MRVQTINGNNVLFEGIMVTILDQQMEDLLSCGSADVNPIWHHIPVRISLGIP